MCLLGIEFRTLPGEPLVLLANREEAYARPTAGPHVEAAGQGAPAWIGGTDLLAGGTWLGINSHGLLAAVTNRPRRDVPAAPRSRGLLCRSLLAFATPEAASRAAAEQLQQLPYAGCNLLLATRTSAIVIEFADELRVQALTPGLHLLTNGALNDPDDGRIARVRAELERSSPNNVRDWIESARRICALPGDGARPPICLMGEDRGTVSSTVLALGQSLPEVQYWYAPGPPLRTTYVDHSPQLRELVSATALPAHRILLRGPWHCESIARADRGSDGESVRGRDALPAPTSAHLPATWIRLFETFRGRVAFVRRFHRPTNLEAHERVRIAIDGLCGPAQVSVNGQALGTAEFGQGAFRCDVTPFLTANNELRIELEVVDAEVAATPIWQAVALEIG